MFLSAVKMRKIKIISVLVSLGWSDAGPMAEATSRRPDAEGPEQDRRRLQLRLRGDHIKTR